MDISIFLKEREVLVNLIDTHNDYDSALGCYTPQSLVDTAEEILKHLSEQYEFKEKSND